MNKTCEEDTKIVSEILVPLLTVYFGLEIVIQ